MAALSGPVQPQRVDAGLQALRDLGFEPVPAANLRSRSACGLFAGSDAERLDAFHELAADPSLRAIAFARGGYGVMRLLPHFDWDLLAANPRAYLGYSDLTPFLLEVVRRLHLVAFHGPMPAVDLARGLEVDEERSLLDALAGRYPQRLEPQWWADRQAPAVCGPLLGGCLSLLVSLLGTPYAPNLEGCVLFWEELQEPLYRLDRMLTHLHLSGRLSTISGMCIGHIWWPESVNSDMAWKALIETCRETLPERPLAGKLPAGHQCPNLTLPLGMQARLDPGEGVLELG